MNEATNAPLQSRAVAKFVHITPRKMRLVANLVRGRKVTEAVDVLAFSLKRASGPIEKAVRSALANMMQQDTASKLDPAEVFIHEIRVDEGPTQKRWRPRAMGRAYRILKRTSHLTVVLEAKPGKTEKQPKQPNRPMK